MAGVPDFKKVANASEDTAKLQERLQEFFTPIAKCNLIDGVLLTRVSVGTSATLISHLLGREPQGWLVVRNRANSVIWDEQDANVFKSRSIALRATAPTVVDLWVF